MTTPRTTRTVALFTTRFLDEQEIKAFLVIFNHRKAQLDMNSVTDLLKTAESLEATRYNLKSVLQNVEDTIKNIGYVKAEMEELRDILIYLGVKEPPIRGIR